MIYRFAMIGIIAFWMVMMGLLVRLETHPEATDILDVPVSYVARIMFKHGQQSLLTVREEGRAIGTISLHPSITGSAGRSLDFSGSLSIQLPLASRQRFNFNGALNMDTTLRVLDFHLDLSVLEPHYRLSAKGDMARKILTYEVRQGEQRTVSQTMPMDGAVLGPALLQNLGLGKGALQSAPAVTARETQIELHGEQLEVYRVTVSEGMAPVADIYVTQLGQVVQATTNFGYDFSGEGLQ